jgi:hypothetical protein
MPEIYAAHPEYSFERDFKGYGEKGLQGLKWPNNAKIAVSFVINYEEVGRIQSEHHTTKTLIAIFRVVNAQS